MRPPVQHGKKKGSGDVLLPRTAEVIFAPSSLLPSRVSDFLPLYSLYGGERDPSHPPAKKERVFFLSPHFLLEARGGGICAQGNIH